MAAAICYFLFPRMGTTILERQEVRNGGLSIRVTAYKETGGFLVGAYYVFESMPRSSRRWKKMMVYRHEDPVKIPIDQIRFVDGTVAYLFMGWKYAVTTDAGKNWSIWSADTALVEWKDCNYILIREAIIHSDGTGTCDALCLRRNEPLRLATVDFGRTWQLLDSPRPPTLHLQVTPGNHR